MWGKNVIYPIGFDNNGLPTEKLIKKINFLQKCNFSNMNERNICLSTIYKIEKSFRKLYIAVGISFDWFHEYSTIRALSQKISQISFLDIFFKKNINKDKLPFLWDSKDNTIVSQNEILNKKLFTKKFNIISKISDIGFLKLKVNNPSVLLSCKIFFLDEKKYNHFIHKRLHISVFNFYVYIFSENIKINKKKNNNYFFNTFSNLEDILICKKYKFFINNYYRIVKPIKNKYFNFLNRNINNFLLFIKVIKLCNLIIKNCHDFFYNIVSEKSLNKLNIITTNQWYLNIMKFRKKIYCTSKKIHWYPTIMKDKLKVWILELNQDWCISRQRHFGISFPFLYKNSKKNMIIPNIEKLPINSNSYNEKNVMDTWYTSSLTTKILSMYILT